MNDSNYNLFDELPGFIEEEKRENERRAQVKFLFDQFYNMNVSDYAIEGCFKRIRITRKIDINDIEKLIEDFPIILFPPLQKLLRAVPRAHRESDPPSEN